MHSPRQSGILLHPSSLPGAYGLGEIGPDAHVFKDALLEMGQGLWQVLPLGPTGYGNSPYQSLSTFAGNALMVSFEGLVAEGLLGRNRIASFPAFPDERVDFGPVIEARRAVFQSVCRTFNRRASREIKDDYDRFCEENADWLEPYALYTAIKNKQQGRPWVDWPEGLAQRDPRALHAAEKQYATSIRNVRILQFLFFRQWDQLRRACNDAGIRLIGDIPIFVAHDSADVWANRNLFHLNESGCPTVVAGVPPDYFSATGQLWGNPLYRWEEHLATGYDWWARRMMKTFEMVDIVRIDHFRGFEKYWEIPAEEKTAINGTWVKGPGASLFDALLSKLGDLPIIAEDLGVITPAVDALRDRFEFPGMRILHFSFGSDLEKKYRPEGYPENCVVYTGTHDNDTTLGWFHNEPGDDSTQSRQALDEERGRVLDSVGHDPAPINWKLIKLALNARSNTAIFPLQDLLGLGSEARMNVPGVLGGNWEWRFTWDQLSPEVSRKWPILRENRGGREWTGTGRHHFCPPYTRYVFQLLASLA